MIEFCTVKRMVMLVAALGIFCIIFLGVENALTKDSPKFSDGQDNLTDDKGACWKVEKFMVKEECNVCTNFEKVSGHLPVCLITGYKELIKCEKSGDVYRSCARVPWLDRRNFWLFEGLTFIMGLLAWCVVYLRQKQLDHRMLQRIQKQIASGV